MIWFVFVVLTTEDNTYGIDHIKRTCSSALFTVMRQEIDRFNNLLEIMHKSLKALKRAVKGEVVMSQTLEESYNALLNQRVPPEWTVRNMWYSIHSSHNQRKIRERWTKYFSENLELGCRIFFLKNKCKISQSEKMTSESGKVREMTYNSQGNDITVRKNNITVRESQVLCWWQCTLGWYHVSAMQTVRHFVDGEGIAQLVSSLPLKLGNRVQIPVGAWLGWRNAWMRRARDCQL